MPDAYRELLDAAIDHLRTLKARGVRFLPANRALLDALRQPAVVAPRSRTSPSSSPSTPPVSRPRSATPGPFYSFDTTASSAPVAPGALPGQDGGGSVVLAAASASAPAGELQETPADPAASPSTAPSTGDAVKAEAMRNLRERALVCVKCPNLAGSRTNVVFGVGNIDAELMFVGEAPGADEDRQGEPFVGAAGQLLTRIIQATGLAREQVYIANILKCRPDTPGQTAGNRKPTPEEMRTCIPYLHAQIDLIRPRVLVALGGTAVEGLLGSAVGITKLRGQWQEYRGIPLMPTFHPSYLLRNQAPAEKRKVWEDMMQVMERLGMPISEKQRGYFLAK